MKKTKSMAHFDARDLDLNIDPKALKSLFSTRPYIHLSALLLEWVVIASVIYLCVNYFHPALYFATVIIIGARMHGMAILMHDASHYRFLKSRKWNDLVTNLLTMYPLFTSIETYRQNHHRHHQHLNTEEDPDWHAKLDHEAFQFPQSKQEFIGRILSYFLIYPGVKDAIWFLKRFSGAPQSQNPKTARKLKIQRIAFNVILLFVLTYFSLWTYFLLYWFVPYLTTFFQFQYIRSVAEHFGELEYDHLLNSTRSVKPSLLEKWILAPHNVSYHIEHHLYPGVPYYNLPALHNLLMQDPEYAKMAHCTDSYFPGLLRELGT